MTTLAIAAAFALSCARTATSGAPLTAPGATASLVDSAGTTIGTATFRQQGPGVRIDVELRGIPDGAHGIHVHAVGACSPTDFASAGPHFDNDGKKHGMKNPAGPHAGDLPNIVVQNARSTAYTATTQRVTLEDGPTSLFDADGSALVVHAAPDDDVTDPSGNSGARIACGIIRRAP